jgi:hypothetical protein
MGIRNSQVSKALMAKAVFQRNISITIGFARVTNGTAEFWV